MITLTAFISEFLMVAWTLSMASIGEPRESKTALAWLMRNQATALEQIAPRSRARRNQPSRARPRQAIAAFRKRYPETAYTYRNLPLRSNLHKICLSVLIYENPAAARLITYEPGINRRQIRARLKLDGDAIQIWQEVCANQLPDPTRGARYYHFHHQSPGWSEYKTPTALIGPRLYYIDSG